MDFFIDTANIKEIKNAYEMGVICGVTTNPTLIARQGRDFHQTITEIANIVDGPISAEVIGSQCDKMIEEALELSKIHKNIVIKIPMTEEGLKAVKILSSKGIKTNVTLIFSASQALLAAKAGASYVSPFLGRLDDIGANGLVLIHEIMNIFKNYDDISTKVIAASIRSTDHIVGAALAGCDIATVPYKILMEMIKHPLTDKGIQQFMNDWNKVFNK